MICLFVSCDFAEFCSKAARVPCGLSLGGEYPVMQSCIAHHFPPAQPLFQDWTTWSDCSVSCGIGATTRSWSCGHLFVWETWSIGGECLRLQCMAAIIFLFPNQLYASQGSLPTDISDYCMCMSLSRRELKCKQISVLCRSKSLPWKRTDSEAS